MSRQPRKHQQQALDAINGRTNFALLMAMRTGKSKVVIDDFDRLVRARKVDDLLVIAPGGACSPWKDAVPLDITFKAKVFLWNSKEMTKRASLLELDDFLHQIAPRVLIMNIEALSGNTKRARAVVEKFLERRTMVVVDESVVIKNRDAKRTKYLLNEVSPRAAYRRILTGLVAPRNPMDVYTQFKFLDPSIFPESFFEFESKYSVATWRTSLPDHVVRNYYIRRFKQQPSPLAKKERLVERILADGGSIPHWPQYHSFKNLDDLQKRLNKHSFKVRLEDTYDMPESSYEFLDVDMTDEQRDAYGQMQLSAIAELEDMETVTAQSVLAQMLRLHQIVCGFTMNDSGEITSFKENRVGAILEMLDGYDGKAIIWCAYRNSIERMAEALRKEYGENAVARFYGDNLHTRNDEEAAFKTDPNCRFMLATADAGGRGRTWDMANLVVYHSCRNNLDHRLQSEERAKNVGKTIPITYVDLRAPGTVDETIIDALRNKIDLASKVTGEDFKKWLTGGAK